MTKLFKISFKNQFPTYNSTTCRVEHVVKSGQKAIVKFYLHTEHVSSQFCAENAPCHTRQTEDIKHFPGSLTGFAKLPLIT